MNLSPTDLQALESRWIDASYATRARLERVDSLRGGELVRHNGKGNYDGIAIPYYWPGETTIRDYRLRRDHPDMEAVPGGGFKTRGKYLSPPGRGNLPYLPVDADPNLLKDKDTAIVITEGEFKTIALWRLAWYDLSETAISPRFLPIGLPGVWNWRGTIGKTTDAEGTRVDVKGVIADFDRITWDGRRVTILFDADVEENDGIRAARRALTTELQVRGATVLWFRWPSDRPHGAKGVDDYLVLSGPTVVLDHISKSKTQRAKVIRDDAIGWRALLLTNKDGSPKPVLANAITALRESPVWDGVLAYNLFSAATVSVKPTPWGIAGAWTDHEDRLTADWLQHSGIFASVETASQAVQVVAQSKSFHPVQDYLNSLHWDGINRLDSWLHSYLGCNTSSYTSAVGARWLISAVARVFSPGIKADCCLILEGEQGTLKSTALKALSDPWFTDEIDDIGSKDASLQTLGVWFIEISELDSMSRAEVGRVKAFMSRTTDRFRPPYGKRLIESPRQCVFAGSSNHAKYLRDETGGRRFWPVSCSRIRLSELRRDRDQLWAETLHSFRAGRPWWLDSKELNDEATTEQEARYEGDAWEEPISEWIKDPSPRLDHQGHPLDPPLTSTPKSISMTDILVHCLGKRMDSWTKIDKDRIGRILRTLRYDIYRVGSGTREWRYKPFSTGRA